MRLTIGPFTLTVELEHHSTNLRKAVTAALAQGKIPAIKKARELRPEMSLKEAVDYVNTLLPLKSDPV